MAVLSNSLASISKTLKPSPPRNAVFNFSTSLSKSHLKLKHTLKPSVSTLFYTTVKPKTHQLKPYYHPVRCLFTGIVESMGEIKQLGLVENGGFEMKICSKTVLEDVNLGDSISVNGTCLTVTEYDTNSSQFTVGLSPETLRKTSLVELGAGSMVNLERALKPTTRMGGHFVQGHVDGTGEIVLMETEGDSLWVKVKTTADLLRYIVPKGFIAVDGTSLTVVKVYDEEECFDFMLVAYTQQKIVIPNKKVGQKVNLEVDILGKYVERLLSSGFVSSIKSS